MRSVTVSLDRWANGEEDALSSDISSSRNCLGQDAYSRSLEWRINRDAIIHSTRPCLGPWIIRFQALMRRLTWWFLEPILQQIETFQMNVALLLEKGLHSERAAERLGNLETLAVEILKRGIPIPSGDLINLVGGHPDVPSFLIGGALAAQNMFNILEGNGISIGDFEAILDFGCGCGRVIRHWKQLQTGRLYGTDLNPKLVEWCRQNISFAEFAVNGASPPTNYDDWMFDFVYVLSVFTHLPEALQSSWMEELARVLRPGGFLLITTRGRRYLSQLTLEEQQQFLEGRLVVRCEELAGTDECEAFHPEQYVRDTLAKDFTVVDFIPQGAKGSRLQDVYLLRKP